ncbi:MAG: DMT family transporter [Pseudomonadota bacterium]
MSASQPQQSCCNAPVTPAWNSTYLTGLLLVTAATLAWSTAGLFTRVIALDSWTLLFWRGVFGGLAIALVVMIISRGSVSRQLAGMGRAGWLFAAVSAAGMVFYISALKQTTVAHVSVLYAVIPLVTAAVAWWAIGERPSRSVLVASVVSLLGVCIMMGLATQGTWFGDLLAMGMTLCLAIMMVIGRACPDVPILPAACVSAFLSALMALPFSAPLSVQPQQWLWLVGFGVVNSALGLTLFIIGSKMLPAVETALITALDAPMAPLWVWLIFSDTPDTATLIGGSIVFIAVARYLYISAAVLEADLPGAGGRH